MAKFAFSVFVIIVAYFTYTLYAYQFVLNRIKDQAPIEMRMGNTTNPTHTIIGYVDYALPESRQLHTLFLNLIARADDTEIIIRPISSEDNNSILAQKLVLTAQNLNQFLETHNALMTASSSFDEAFMERAIRSVGLNYESVKGQALSADIESEAVNLNAETILVNLNQIPSFYIDHHLMEGASYSVSDILKIMDDLKSGRL
jgi:hypothetical protein